MLESDTSDVEEIFSECASVAESTTSDLAPQDLGSRPPSPAPPRRMKIQSLEQRKAHQAKLEAFETQPFVLKLTGAMDVAAYDAAIIELHKRKEELITLLNEF